MANMRPVELTLSDEEYIAAFNHSDSRVQGIFYRDCLRYYNNRSSAFIPNSADKDDVFQESFLILWNEIEQKKIQFVNGQLCRYNTGGQLQPMVTSLLTFLMSICKKQFLICQKRREAELSFEEWQTMAKNGQSAPKTTHSYVNSNEMREIIVDKCIDALPERCRDILTKFYYLEMSLDEILISRHENNSKDGLKTGKYKCMKQLELRIKESFSAFHIKI